MKVLTNALGISDSGGITVLHKYLEEIINSSYSTVVCYNDSPLMIAAVSYYQNNEKILFIAFKRSGFLKRLWIEHFEFKKIIERHKLKLIYNLSGSAQFLDVLQLIKLQNLMFYSRSLDMQYKQQGKYLSWLKQIFIKRHIFLNLYKHHKNFEIQSPHVEESFLTFNHTEPKKFFIKSDIDVRPENFSKPRDFDFSQKVYYLYIVGPHFQMVHKNFKDFVEAMILQTSIDKNFEIVITLSEAQLTQSSLWDSRLTPFTRFIGYVPQAELQTCFKNNTILFSTSIVETLGLHVIEAIKHGCISIVPNEHYATSVYGKDVVFYETNNPRSLSEKISSIKKMTHEECTLMILKAQENLKNNERSKISHITDVFDTLLQEATH